jgi:hypothetical protein
VSIAANSLVKPRDITTELFLSLRVEDGFVSFIYLSCLFLFKLKSDATNPFDISADWGSAHRKALVTSVAGLFSCLNGAHCFI